MTWLFASFGYWGYAKLKEGVIINAISNVTSDYGLKINKINVSNYVPFSFDTAVEMDVQLERSEDILNRLIDNLKLDVDSPSHDSVAAVLQSFVDDEDIIHVQIHGHQIKISTEHDEIIITFDNHLFLEYGSPVILKSLSGNFVYDQDNSYFKLELLMDGINQQQLDQWVLAVLDPTKDEQQIASEFQQTASRIVFHTEYKDEQIDSQFTLDARGFETAYSSIGHREKINEVRIEGEYNALQGPKKIKMSRGYLTPDAIFWDILSPSLKNFQSDNDVPLEISFQVLAHEVNPSELIHFIESDGLSDTTAFDDVQTALSLKIGDNDLVFDANMNIDATSMTMDTNGTLLVSERLSHWFTDFVLINNPDLALDDVFFSNSHCLSYQFHADGYDIKKSVIETMYLSFRDENPNTEDSGEVTLLLEDFDIKEETINHLHIGGSIYQTGQLADQSLRNSIVMLIPYIVKDDNNSDGGFQKALQTIEISERFKLDIEFEAHNFSLENRDFNSQLTVDLKSDLADVYVVLKHVDGKNTIEDINATVYEKAVDLFPLFAKLRGNDFTAEEIQELKGLSQFGLSYNKETDDMVFFTGDAVLHIKGVNSDDRTVTILEAKQINRIARLFRILTRLKETDDDFYPPDEYEDMVENYINRVFGSMEGKTGTIELPLIELLWKKEQILVDTLL